MRKKYQIGGVMGLTSSPLSSMTSNYTQEFADKWQPTMNQMQFQTGLAIQNSSNPILRLQGNQMMQDSINSFPSFIDPKTGKNKGSGKAGIVGTAIGVASDIIGSFLPQKDEYDGPKGDVTQTMDSVYDGISDAAMSLGPVGMLVGGIMKGGAMLGKGVNALGGGTDGMTTTDAILESSFLSLTPIGLINGFGGSKADTITKDDLAFEQVGSSYTGSNMDVNNALTKSGKKYGLFSQKAKNKANKEIQDARRQQYTISNIADDAYERFAIRNSMAAINENRRAFNMQGGYDQQAVIIGRSGLKIDSIEKAKNILNKYNKQQTNQLQQGGTLDPFEYYLESLPENQRDSTNFRVKDYWIFNGKPKDFKEARRRGMFTQEKDGWHASSIAENPETGEIEYMKASSHPTRHMESDWYEYGLIYNEDQNGNVYTIQLEPGVPGYEDWKKFTHDYELVKSEPYWKYVKRKQKEIPSHKEGGTFIEVSMETFIELVDPTSIPEFQNGGTFSQTQNRGILSQKIKDYYKDYDLSNVTLINDSVPRTEGNIIYSPGDEYTVHELWHYLSQNKPNEALKEFYDQLDDTKLQKFGADLKFVKRTGDPGDFYNPSELEARLKAAKFMSQGSSYNKKFFRNLRNNENRYGDNMRDLLRMFDDDHLEKLFNTVSKFQNGGSINVIPDGALHARKHNMDVDGITKKGIPVVSESNGEIEQQAEIEKEEIIFRLEVTQKLEELEKKFYSDESTQEEKDECALGAGKLLVNEILYNTQDNTGLLNKI